MQIAIQYAVVTLLMSGVLIGFGLPFILVAWAVFRWTAGRITGRARPALASAIAALGVAPSYDPYGGPLPVTVRLMRGEPVTLLAALVSFAVTWLVLMAFASLVSRRKPSHA